MAGIGVAERAEGLVIAGDESGTGKASAGDLDKAAIQAKAELRHGFGLIDVGAGEEFCAAIAKNLLSGCENAAIVFATAGYVEQAKEDPFGAYADGVVKVSRNAFSG